MTEEYEVRKYSNSDQYIILRRSQPNRGHMRTTNQFGYVSSVEMRFFKSRREAIGILKKLIPKVKLFSHNKDSHLDISIYRVDL